MYVIHLSSYTTISPSVFNAKRLICLEYQDAEVQSNNKITGAIFDLGGGTFNGSLLIIEELKKLFSRSRPLLVISTLEMNISTTISPPTWFKISKRKHKKDMASNPHALCTACEFSNLKCCLRMPASKKFAKISSASRLNPSKKGLPIIVLGIYLPGKFRKSFFFPSTCLKSQTVYCKFSL
jgi:hypothetical protein